MTKTQSYGSRFLYAEDLLKGGEFKSPSLTIRTVYEPGSLSTAQNEKIELRRDGSKIWSIDFEGSTKILVLSAKCNEKIIHTVTGFQPGQDWVGKTIQIQARNVEAFGEQTLAIRVIPPKGTMIRKSLLKRLGTEAVFNAQVEK